MAEDTGFSGIDMETGAPHLDSLTDEELGELLLGLEDRDWRDGDEERRLKGRHRDLTSGGVDRRPAADVEPLSLASSGWGVIFTKDENSQKAKEALKPLLDHRRSQASLWHPEYYKEIEYKPGETAQWFINQHGGKGGPVDPADGLPYYLMIVGSPEQIPHHFQYHLDLQFAVGRLFFDDPDDYGRYAKSVIEAEKGLHHVRPEATFFAVEGDETTQLMAEHFVDPLYKHLRTSRPEWNLRQYRRGSKDELQRLLGGAETPALLMTAAHGLVCESGHDLQKAKQGAILCQEPFHGEPLRPEHYFSAADLGCKARVHGSVVFLFGCYSAGTPRVGNFPAVARRAMGNRAHETNVAPEAFVSALAQRLLGHPNGGALAVLGHVDRAWTRSFGGSSGQGFAHIESLAKNLLDGYPVGSAMDWMHERFAEWSTELTGIMNKYGERPAQPPSSRQVARLWRANNDARNFVVLGDPAVRLSAGPRAALGGMSLLYDRGSEGRSPLKRPDWRKLLGAWLREPGRCESVQGINPEDAVREIRS